MHNEPNQSAIFLESVVTTGELESRPSRIPDYQAQCEALDEIAKLLGESPQAAMRGLADQALKLCRAESAGISISESDNGEEIFRWHAVSGSLSPHLYGTMPRYFSPCGVVLDRKSAVLMEDLPRYYNYVKALGLPFGEVLLVPFYHRNNVIGTVWVVSHQQTKHFDLEDKRLLEALANFTSGVVQSYFRVKAEEDVRSKLQAFFSQSPLPMVMLEGPTHRFVLANDSYENLVGRKVVGKTIQEVFEQDEIDYYIPILNKVYETGAPFLGKELPLQLRIEDGITQAMWIDAGYHPLRDESDRVNGILVVIHDVTQQVQARKKVESNVIQLEELRELRERFVTALTHDLRTPLTSAKMNAQLLERKPLDSEFVRTAARRISLSVDRAENMVRDLLDANRIKAGEGIPLKLESCRLDEVIEKSVQELITLNGNRFELFKEKGAIEGIWDGNGIERVIENLATNAVKYGKADAIVTLSLKKHENHVELKVHNQGDPIPAEEQKKLFDSYRRSESAILSGQKGWGIGLTLVKGIAEAHKGSVNLISDLTDGTTFTVRLPLDSRIG